jgi:hypothetical protein
MAVIPAGHLDQQPDEPIVLFQNAAGQVSLEVRLEADSASLNQAQMAETPCTIPFLHTCHASKSTASPTAWESFPSRLSSR